MTDVRTMKLLTALRTGMVMFTAGLLFLYAGLWIGITPEDVCLAVGLAGGIVAVLTWCIGVSTANPYLERPLIDHLARDVRRLGWACAAVAVLILAYPPIP